MEIVKVEPLGQSQIIRIPKIFRLNTLMVKISRKGDQIILSPVSQEDMLNAFLAVPSCPDFSIERDSDRDIV